MNVKPATAKISSHALKQNLEIIRQKAPNSKIIAVVKANAYGHGVVFVASNLEQNVDCFGVARLEEALALRSNGITKPILLLEGFFNEQDLAVLAVNNIETIVHNREQLEALKRANLPSQIKVWLKIDTGMHRLGVALDEVDFFYNELKKLPYIQPHLGFVSHFSRADELESNYTQLQINRFLCATKDKQGEPVGYGGIWTSSHDTKIGVVAIGYGDGYPRDVPEGTPVYLNGRIVPIVGRVSMDMLTVDLGPDSQDQVGDEVILWGKELPIETVAKFTGILSYELITKLTPRVITEYVD